MRAGVVVMGLVLTLVCAVLLLSHSLRAKRQRSPSRVGGWMRLEISSAQVLERARSDVEKYGWHLVLVQGEGRPGFLFTIGLWESYHHPEILLFGTEEVPKELAVTISRIAKKVSQGQTFKNGDLISETFRQYAGAIRDIRPEWLPSFLGTATTYYEGSNFPAIQLYWPDKDGLYPWQSGFDPNLFSLQPLLFSENVILSGVGYDELLGSVAELDSNLLEEATRDLYVPLATSGVDLLQSWRWKIGAETKLVRATVFGDVLLQTPAGQFQWLSTGSDELFDLGEDMEDCHRFTYDNPETAFWASTLLHLREHGVSIAAGQVYDWIQEPMIGGTTSADNVQWVPLQTHLEATGQLARSLHTKASAVKESHEDSKARFAVVMNDEEQYSIWPAEKEPPPGWRATGKIGTKEECIDIISELWVDLRPKSQREALRDDPPD